MSRLQIQAIRVRQAEAQARQAMAAHQAAAAIYLAVENRRMPSFRSQRITLASGLAAPTQLMETRGLRRRQALKTLMREMDRLEALQRQTVAQ